MNPLIACDTQPAAAPYRLPDYANIKPEHFLPAFKEGMAENRAAVSAIIANPEEPTWANTVEALENAGPLLRWVSSIFFNLQGTDSSPEFDEIAAQVVPELAAHRDELFQNPALYERVRAVEVPEDEESQRLYEHYMRFFRRMGTTLDHEAQERLKDLNQRLSVLSDEFGRNLLASTKEQAPVINNLDGFSDSRKKMAEESGEQLSKSGPVIPLELPTMQSAQSSLENKESRKALLEASMRRGDTNLPLVLAMVRLRAERAQILGYDTHADYVLEEESAGTKEAAWELLKDLAPAAVANAAGEYKLIDDLAGEESVEHADLPYWEEKYRAAEYGLDAEELSKYFPLDSVLEKGVFFAAERLYGITVTERPDLQGYHPDVKVWEVKEADGTGIGLFLTDYFARPSKRGGAWMSSIQRQSALEEQKPVIINVMNIPKPVDGSTPLLSFDQVTTMFHEFGHALHGLLSQVRYPSFSGTSVPRDYVEFPSQINENWALDPVVLRNYAHHVDTGEEIPQALIDALLASGTWGQGYATSEYLAAAILDLAWHSLTPQEAEAIDDVEAFERETLESYGLGGELMAPRYKSRYFNHIFAGGYSAGYYSYLWAEVLDADGFDWFKEVGAAGDTESDAAAREAGARFRELVLSKGASRDYTESFRKLRGRDKDIKPLLRRRGLDGAV
ncbi:MAG: M3 family metallopeptidase [Corynebacterium sp.]|nr:M3 family metallopeptidase [Corynebacterium sp.]